MVFSIKHPAGYGGYPGTPMAILSGNRVTSSNYGDMVMDDSFGDSMKQLEMITMNGE